MSIKVYGDLRLQDAYFNPGESANFKLKVANSFPPEVKCTAIRLNFSTLPPGMTIQPIEVGDLVGGYSSTSQPAGSYKVITFKITATGSLKPGTYNITITPSYNYILTKQTQVTSKSITVSPT